MEPTERADQDCTWDRSKYAAFDHFYIPQDENDTETDFEPILRTTPAPFIHLAESFKKNFAAIKSTASMPFRIASTNQSRRLFNQCFMAEEIRTLKSEFDAKSDEEKQQIALAVARVKFNELMRSQDRRHQAGLEILADLESLLAENEMKSAAAELMRQSDALTWGTLEVLANDFFITLLNKKPQFSDTLLKDERTKKRFQVKDVALLLSTYAYNLSDHMGDVFGGLVKIDDVDTFRAIYEVLLPSNTEFLMLLRGSELWKLNQRRNLILHRRSIVDEVYIRNTGDALPLGAELIIPPKQLEVDLLLVFRIGALMLKSLETT